MTSDDRPPEAANVPAAAEQARTLDDGARQDAPKRADAPSEPAPPGGTELVESSAGGGVGVPTSSRGDRVLDLFALHDVLCAFLRNVGRFDRVLNRSDAGLLAYYAWRWCERVEQAFGFCPCKRKRRHAQHWTCERCGWSRRQRRAAERPTGTPDARPTGGMP